MKLSKVIARLQVELAVIGDVEVEVRNDAGDFDVVTAVDVVDVGRGGIIQNRVYLDT